MFVTTFSQVFTLRVVDRIGKGLRDAPRDALIAESVPKEELGKSYGFHRAMDTLGAALGPLAAFLLFALIGVYYQILFFVAFVIGLGALASFVFVREHDGSRLQTVRPRKNIMRWQLFRENKRFVFVVLSIFVFGLGTLPIGLVLLKSKEVGFQQARSRLCILPTT
jgi:MFS family permease